MIQKAAPRMRRVGVNLVQSKHHLLGFTLHISIPFNIQALSPQNNSNIPQKDSYKIQEYFNHRNVYLFNEEYEMHPKSAQSCQFVTSQKVCRLQI